jgi:hypothetical protein
MHITGKVLHAKYRIKSNGIQVDHVTDMTDVLQSCSELLENGVAKRLGIRMRASMEENPARRWPTAPERHSVEGLGPLQWAPREGASPASRASEYRHAVYSALGIPFGVWTATWLQPIPQNSLFASATVCPSTPAADLVGIWHRFSQTRGLLMW